MSIVVATLAHASAMAAIHAASFAGRDRWDATAMAELLAMPGCFGLVHGAGGLVMTRQVAGEAEILTLAVHPEARRCGVGSALLMAVMARVGEATMFLEVAPHNTVALKLYNRSGFEVCGTRRHYYHDGTDALVLRRRINVV